MRIAILTSSGLLAAQIAQELIKQGQAVTALAEPAHMSRAAVPSLNSVVPCRSVAPEFPGETFKGKRLAQWKRERSV